MLLIQCAIPSLVYKVKAQQYNLPDYPGNWCLSFDGADDNAYCNPSQLFNATKLTVEVWVKPKFTIVSGSSSNYGHELGTLIHNRPESIADPYTAQYYGWYLGFDYFYGYLVFTIGLGSSSPYVALYYTNQTHWDPVWYHIAVTYDRTLTSGNVRFYVNGSLDSQHDEYRSISYYSNSTLQIGALYNTIHAYGGLIDEVRLWNVARTGSQINDTMQRILSPSETADPNLVGYWPLDEGTGSTSRDNSTYGNNLILPTAPTDPQWSSPGVPIIPEFPSPSVMLVLMATISLGAILLRRRLRKLNPSSFREQPKMD